MIVKKLVYLVFMFLFIETGSFSMQKTFILNDNFEMKSEKKSEVDILDAKLKLSGIDTYRYLSILSKHESSNNYLIVNKYGYMGKYQFHEKTLKSLIEKGYLICSEDSVSRDNFLRSPYMQEYAVRALMLANVKTLQNYNSFSYVGKSIGGVIITKEGLLAAAHLRGARSVHLYLKSNGEINQSDAYKTSVKDYMKIMV